MFKKIAVVAGGVAATATLALGGVAHAGVNYSAVRYTNAGPTTVAGYEAQALQGDLFNFTHVEANLGINSAGAAVLPAFDDSNLVAPGEGDTTVNVTGHDQGITGGVGIELCNTAGYVAQIGLVKTGAHTMDVVAAAGLIGSANQNGDRCENGLVTYGNDMSAAVVLLSNVPTNHAVNVGLLYTPGRDQGYNYNHDGRNHHRSGGTATAYATDDMASSYTNYITIPGVPSGINFNDAASGIVADNAASVPLTGFTVPAADNSTSANRLFTAAHVKVNGNSQVNGTHEVQGAFQSSSAWSVYPVAATSDGTNSGELFADPTLFKSDHFNVLVGSTVINAG